ncbi:MAG: sigma-54-dependent Fis family transcriptional regulator [Deltaproteobacteria bacterium]|nr:MAG: sigma-54-dependent Fis family transcriptional regulator [Deltaproteobacteria bacterium]
MIPFSIWIVDDEEVARDGISMVLERNYQVHAFATAEEAIEAMLGGPPDLVLLDIGLPGMSGIEALVKIKELYPDIVVIMITAYEDVKTVVSAMKQGAYDYVVKPLQMDSLKVTVRNALETIRLRKEIRLLHEKFLKENLPCFIGESDATQDVMDVVVKVAQSPDTSVLIVGETGTGKELIAKAIHYRSPRFQGPLISVNCAAIPKDLIESELFGYEKGAFSGAEKSGKAGLVEKAIDGTLFLDEVGDLSNEAQAKLLRFLEDGEYYRVGGTKIRMAQTRVVAATNKDLPHLIAEGRFRQDLYHRLAVVKIEVPSLNQRRDDILPIAKHYLLEFAHKFGKTYTAISSEAEDALKECNWTGNVRELKNLIEKGVLLGEGPELSLQDLGFDETPNPAESSELENGTRLPALSAAGMNLPSFLDSVEKNYFEEALKIARGNESKAAKLLQMSRDTFRYRRKKMEDSD